MILILWIEARILEDFSKKQRAKMAELRKICFDYDQWLLVRLILYYANLDKEDESLEIHRVDVKTVGEMQDIL